MARLAGPAARPVYAVVLIDAIVIKVRDTQVANRPVYVAIGVNLDGERYVLGMWLGPTGGEGAKQWMTMLTELRNRGIADVLIVCCDGLKGLPDAIRVTWPEATVQTCEDAGEIGGRGRLVVRYESDDRRATRAARSEHAHLNRHHPQSNAHCQRHNDQGPSQWPQRPSDRVSLTRASVRRL